MFDAYAKKLKELKQDVPKIFKEVARKGAIFARNTALNLTDEENLFDTGNFKRKWNGEMIMPQKNVYGVLLENNVEYASHLEFGYTLRKNQFIPFETMLKTGGVKTKSFIAKLKAKYPNAKGFTRKAGKYKGKFIGRRTLDETHVYCIEQLEKETVKAIKKYHQSFTDS